MELDVRRIDARTAAEEAGRLGDVGAQRPASLVLEQRDVGRVGGRHVQRDLVGEVVQLRHAVILQPQADGQRFTHSDPERRQLVLRTNSRDHQQHRRLVRAGRQDHLALGADRLHQAVAGDLNADCPGALEHDPQRHRARNHLEIRPRSSRMQERVRGAAAHPAALGQLEAADALLAGAVEIRVVLVAGLLCGLEQRVNDRMHRAALGYRHRAADPVVGVLAALVVLRALEVRQHIVVAPAGAAGSGPGVVVGAVAADVDHRVDRAAAAEHLAAREVQAAVVEPGLGLALEIPVEA